MIKRNIGPSLALIVTLGMVTFAVAQDDEIEPVDLPDNIAEKAEGLTKEKVDFIRGFNGWKTLRPKGFDTPREDGPMVDPRYTTAQDSNRVIQECLAGIAMHKLGITDPNCFSPLTNTVTTNE